MIWYLSGSTLFPTNNLHYTTFFQANHSINHRNRLYFISVFIYTSIKVNLTKGGKEMASPEPIRTIPAPSLLAAKGFEILTQKQSKIFSSSSHQKRNNHQYALSLRNGDLRAKESHFSLFPFV